MDYKNNSNTGLIIVADCMLLSVEYIGNVHLFFNTADSAPPITPLRPSPPSLPRLVFSYLHLGVRGIWVIFIIYYTVENSPTYIV